MYLVNIDIFNCGSENFDRDEKSSDQQVTEIHLPEQSCNCISIHSISVEIFQSGPKWRTDRPTELSADELTYRALPKTIHIQCMIKYATETLSMASPYIQGEHETELLCQTSQV